MYDLCRIRKLTSKIVLVRLLLNACCKDFLNIVDIHSNMKVCVLHMVFLFVTSVLADQICDKCNCHIRDTLDRGNINVKPVCRQGKITWLNPSSAIRLELHPGIPGSFKACISLKSENILTLISKEMFMEKTNYRTRSKESSIELVPWFTVTGEGKDYCVTSSDSSVLLYLEIESTTADSGLSRVFMYYDIEMVSSLQSNPMEECRPCNEEEMLKAYCISEFVVSGNIIDVKYQSEVDKTRVDIQIEQIIKQTDEDLFTRSKPESEHLHGSIYTHVQCGARKGLGTFLFTGQTRLGKAVLTCAPFYEQWVKVLQTAKDLGTLACSYS